MKLALRIPRNRFGLILVFLFLLVGISTLTRMALLIRSAHDVDFTVPNVIGIFLIGFLADLLNALYSMLPLAIYVWLLPSKLFVKKWHHYVILAIFFLIAFAISFNAVSEWLFWDEFNTRYNFIAVDYLVYTTEVIGNITQSYPIGWMVLIIFIVASLFAFLLRKIITESAAGESGPFRLRTYFISAYAVLLLLAFTTFDNTFHRFSKNEYVNELAGNGLYELFSAYRHNELNYEQFYKGMDARKSFELLRALIKTREAQFISSDPFSIERRIQNTGQEKKLNVVLISVESFSADFMHHFGNTQNITPFLDSLAEKSLLFTSLYATGTRTVRGLEALSLSIPPTPGQSIVRRPNNEGLFSLGKVFHEKGYHTEYIYGGYGYFDNMNYFFSHNNYEVTDRTELKDEEIDYENIWGVADENLFALALKEMDTHTPQQPVFAHIMTTSNHRPFTYPDGRIDIPSHTGREGAVKYTDYSIGWFIRKAKTKPWFANTVFVIVADHCASSAGKTELPQSSYHIPMMIYSPANIEGNTMNRLMSQIDVAPTVLGLLNFSYTSKFFGYDIFKLEPGRERAFISTYQSLGYMTNNELVILKPQFKSSLSPMMEASNAQPRRDAEAEQEAIVWYQTASYAFRHGLLK